MSVIKYCMHDYKVCCFYWNNSETWKMCRNIFQCFQLLYIFSIQEYAICHFVWVFGWGSANRSNRSLNQMSGSQRPIATTSHVSKVVLLPSAELSLLLFTFAPLSPKSVLSQEGPRPTGHPDLEGVCHKQEPILTVTATAITEIQFLSIHNYFTVPVHLMNWVAAATAVFTVMQLTFIFTWFLENS